MTCTSTASSRGLVDNVKLSLEKHTPTKYLGLLGAVPTDNPQEPFKTMALPRLNEVNGIDHAMHVSIASPNLFYQPVNFKSSKNLRTTLFQTFTIK